MVARYAFPRRSVGTSKQAELKAFAEYEKFNKQQRIESDFDREVKKLLLKKDAEE